MIDDFNKKILNGAPPLLNWVEAGKEAHNRAPVRTKGYEA